MKTLVGGQNRNECMWLKITTLILATFYIFMAGTLYYARTQQQDASQSVKCINDFKRTCGGYYLKTDCGCKSQYNQYNHTPIIDRF
jgi:hypothetical protein